MSRSGIEKVVVIVFDSEGAAPLGVKALYELEDEARIALYELAAIRRNSDGTTARMREDDDFPAPSGTLAGAAIGSLIGLLGGGIGFAAGAGIGALIGLIRDVHTAAVDSEFIADVSSALSPGKFAVIADVREVQVTPLDRRVEALGGVVFRAPKIDDCERRERESAARRIELEQLEMEHAGADDDRKPSRALTGREVRRRRQEGPVEVLLLTEGVQEATARASLGLVGVGEPWCVHQHFPGGRPPGFRLRLRQAGASHRLLWPLRGGH